MTAPANLPPGRYGRVPTSRHPHWRRRVFAALAVAAGVVVALLAYVNLGSAPIEAQRLAFTEQPGNAMKITISVARDDPRRPAVCIVRVRDISGAESGRKEVLVPAADATVVVSTVIKSIGRPVTADVFGCTYAVPAYLSTPLRPTG